MKKNVVILYIICCASWLVCSVINFAYGNTSLGVFQLVLFLMWAVIAVVNIIRFKK